MIESKKDSKDKKVDITQKDVLHKDLQNLIIKALQTQNITPMPKNPFRNIRDFKKGFDSIKGNKGIIKTPYKDVDVNIGYAWKHFITNTYGKNRDSIKGGFFATFKDPLFVVTQRRKEQENPSVYFYKPFFDKENNRIDLFGIGLDSNGKIDFKTYYKADSDSRLLNLLNDESVEIKYTKA